MPGVGEATPARTGSARPPCHADADSGYIAGMTTLVIADDHPLFRKALAATVREVLPAARCVEADTLAATRALLATEADADLVLLDLHMPDSHGLMGLSTLRCEHPQVAVLMISAHDDPHTIRRALAYGACGFVSKSACIDEIARALTTVLDCGEYLPDALRQAVAAGKAPGVDRDLAARLALLTPQQFRVLALVAEGKLNKQIADALGVQERTVKAHLSAIFERLGVRNRTQAGVLLRTLELTDPARGPLRDDATP